MPARPGSGGDLVREAQRSPSGPRVAAFFDLDRTLIDGYSAIAFILHRLRAGELPARELAASLATATAYQLGLIPFETFLAETSAATRDVPEAALHQLGEEVFDRDLVHRIFPDARRLIEAHRRRGHFLAIVTSATRYQVEPVARALGIGFVACSALEVERGRLTGRIALPPCHGDGKREAAERFAARFGIELARSVFYTDSHEDLPLLEAVGRPRPVNPTRALARIAAERRWPIHVLAAPPGPIRRRIDALGRRWSSPGGRAARPETA